MTTSYGQNGLRRLMLACVLAILSPAGSHAADASANSLPAGLPFMPAPGTAASSDTAPAPSAAQSAAGADMRETLTLTLAEMGQKSGLTLSGGQLQSGVVFSLPRDRVVTQAKVMLALKASPELAASDYTVQLMLNGQPLGSLPLGQDSANNGVYHMDIPASIMVAANNLSFRLTSGAQNDGAMGQCEKNLPDNYRLTLLPTSMFELNGLRLDNGRSLANLPRPFFDPDLMKEASIPVAFSAQPGGDVIAAAGVAASWFGAQAGFRDADFPVLLNALPQGNGIIVGKPGESIGAFTLPEGDGGMLRIVDNPTNPVYKLLLITGHNESELRQAAWRLASAPLPATDGLAVQAQTIPLRQPYDAPRWISTRQPVSLAFNGGAGNLVVNGGYHGAIPVSFRAAPDVFMWNNATIPLDLFYHFPAETWLDEAQSHLSVSMNGVFVRNLPVNKSGPLATLMRYAGFDTRQEHATLQLNPYLIYGDNQLEFYFAVNPTADAPCGALNSANIRSRIEPDSTLDLRHAYHFAQLPNLAYFVGASFPFTRRADLAQTVLLLPDAPAGGDIQTLLDLLARAGNATGAPAAHLSVALGADAVARVAKDNDILAVASLAHEDFIRRLLAGSPFNAAGAMLGVGSPNAAQQARSYLAGNWFGQFAQANRYLSSIYSWRGFLSFAPAQRPDRVVVLVTATDDAQLVKLHNDLKSPVINAGIGGDIAVISNENDIRTFQVGPQFATGDLPWYLQTLWYAGKHLIVLSILALLAALLAGVRVYAALKHHAARRLGKGPDFK